MDNKSTGRGLMKRSMMTLLLATLLAGSIQVQASSLMDTVKESEVYNSKTSYSYKRGVVANGVAIVVSVQYKEKAGSVSSEDILPLLKKFRSNLDRGNDRDRVQNIIDNFQYHDSESIESVVTDALQNYLGDKGEKKWLVYFRNPAPQIVSEINFLQKERKVIESLIIHQIVAEQVANKATEHSLSEVNKTFSHYFLARDTYLTLGKMTNYSSEFAKKFIELMSEMVSEDYREESSTLESFRKALKGLEELRPDHKGTKRALPLKWLDSKYKEHMLINPLAKELSLYNDFSKFRKLLSEEDFLTLLVDEYSVYLKLYSNFDTEDMNNFVVYNLIRLETEYDSIYADSYNYKYSALKSMIKTLNSVVLDIEEVPKSKIEKAQEIIDAYKELVNK